MDFRLSTDSITLGQLIKAAGLVATGGEAKFLLESGEVTVNGEPETRRGRKLYPNDNVEFPNGETLNLK